MWTNKIFLPKWSCCTFLYSSSRVFSHSPPPPASSSSSVFETLNKIVSHTTASLVPKDDAFVSMLFSGMKQSNRASLARGITLVESTHPIKKAQGQLLLNLAVEHLLTTRETQPTFRIGLSGPPGAGKSTFIEFFGNYLTQQPEHYRVAVLAVDPSSVTTGGSLLGDKTRMPLLTQNPNAYIRPSPSAGSVGGVTRSTSEAINLCEASNYDIVLVETMGVGQAEFAVADMVDVFCLILPPAAGDELQGLKRGIVEMADFIIVNKCDGDLMPAARRTAMEYTSALKFMKPRSPLWRPKIHLVSALEKNGAEDLWSGLTLYRQVMLDKGEFQLRRRQQKVVHLWTQLQERVLRIFRENPHISQELVLIEQLVLAGQITPGQAADYLLQIFQKQI